MEWVGGRGWAVRAGGQLKLVYIIHWNRDRMVVSSIKHRNSHSVHVRPRQSLAAV